MELREYQVTLSKQASEILSKYKIVYLAMEVRTGKTLTALETAKLFGSKKVLFVTKKKAIKSILKDYTDFNYTFELEVINYESVHKVTGQFDIVIIDESHSCFVGDTLINGIKIKDINLHSIQKSYTFANNKVSENLVLNKFKKPLNEDLVVIKCNGKEIVCTENHLIYTKNGYKKAKEITTRDELLVMQ